MHTAIRAHRILKGLSNYQQADKADDWSDKLIGENFGLPVGFYRNPEPEGVVIEIFSNGLRWLDHRGTVELRFSDILEVALLAGKESEGLALKTQGDQQFFLPITGHRGRFFDSMEMLRFLDRVIQDLRKR